MAFGAAAILAALSAPALAGNLVTNGGFETNFGAGQFNQTLPGSAGGQNASHPGTTASDWTVTGTNSSYPNGYAFIFNNANSFTTSNGHVGPASESANPSGSNTLPLWGNSSDKEPRRKQFLRCRLDLSPVGSYLGDRRPDRRPHLYAELRLCGRSAVRL
jgi:hypothetical protein